MNDAAYFPILLDPHTPYFQSKNTLDSDIVAKIGVKTGRTYGVGYGDNTYSYNDNGKMKVFLNNQIKISNQFDDGDFADHGDSGSLIVKIEFLTKSIQIQPFGILHRYVEDLDKNEKYGYAFDLNSFLFYLGTEYEILFEDKFAFFNPKDYIIIKEKSLIKLLHLYFTSSFSFTSNHFSKIPTLKYFSKRYLIPSEVEVNIIVLTNGLSKFSELHSQKITNFDFFSFFTIPLDLFIQ